MNRRITHAAVVFSLACAPAIASAQSFNIDFDTPSDPGAGAPSAGFAAAAGYSSALGTSNYWNSIKTAANQIQLRDRTGAVSQVRLSFQSFLQGPFSGDQTQLTGDYERLLADWVMPSSPFVFENLEPGSYTVLTYGGSELESTVWTMPTPPYPVAQTTKRSPNAVNAFYSGDSVDASTASHTVHETQVGPDQTLSVTLSPLNSSKIAGIQLIYNGPNFAAPLVAAIESPPVDSCILSGPIQIIGSTSGPSAYIVEYSTSIDGPFTQISAGNGGASSTVLAEWNTSSLPSGVYFVRLTVAAADALPRVTVTSFKVVPASPEPPVASFVSPANTASVCGIVPILGSVQDANLSSWTLDYLGPQSNGWSPLASGNTPVTSGILAQWDTAGLPRGAYALRLRASESGPSGCTQTAPQVTTSYRTLVVGPQSDISFDGAVNTTDLSRLLGEFGFNCH